MNLFDEIVRAVIKIGVESIAKAIQWGWQNRHNPEVRRRAVVALAKAEWAVAGTMLLATGTGSLLALAALVMQEIWNISAVAPPPLLEIKAAGFMLQFASGCCPRDFRL